MMRAGIFGPLGHPTYAQYAEDIHNSGAALLTKIDDLLGIACIHHEAHTLEPTRFPVRDLLGELMIAHGDEASARGVILRPDAADGIESKPTVNNSPPRCSHLIANAPMPRAARQRSAGARACPGR